MWKQASSLLLALAAAVVLPAAPPAAGSAQAQNSGENRYKSIRLTPEIYANAGNRLSTLLLTDDKGDPVPYFIHSAQTAERLAEQSYRLQIVDSYEKDDAFYFDYKVAPLPDEDVVATSIVFAPEGGSFAKPVVLSGSHDGKSWQTVQDDLLYSVDGIEKTEITFASPQKFSYYRLRLANNLEKISFDGARLVYSVKSYQTLNFIETLSPAFAVAQDGKQTLITVQGLKNLKLESLTLQTDSMFKRTVSIRTNMLSAQNTLYNLAFADTDYRNLTLPLDGQQSDDDAVTAVIQNNDDRPIDISGVTVRYYADELVFDGSASKLFTLSLANTDDADSLVYDIASYKNDVLRGPIDRLELGALSLAQHTPAPPETDYKLIFNVVLIAVTVLLGVLILRKLRKK